MHKEGTKLASRQEFAKRVALDLFRCVLPCLAISVSMQNNGCGICSSEALLLHCLKQQAVCIYIQFQACAYPPLLSCCLTVLGTLIAGLLLGYQDCFALVDQCCVNTVPVQ